MFRIACPAAGVLLLFPSLLTAQNAVGGADAIRKEAQAVRFANDAIRVDGALDDDAWKDVAPIADFIQTEPDEGAPPTQRMEVRFAYDGMGLYVGARMYSSQPLLIQAPLGRRDNAPDQSEHILVSFDTFLDHRTAYTFGVSASGVRFDRFHATDDQSFDAGFNPVWEAKTRIDADGWTAELWIPFSQLRFNARSEQVWGLNVKRVTPTLKEQVLWVLIPRTVRAWASRFGVLGGISDVHPPKRIELLPVLVGSSRLTAARDPSDPFDDGRNLSSRAGADLKMGLGPSLTLDATINPDFGQVEADPSEVNLTAFATRFPERRPFFTEGAGLLTLNHTNAFYSRRIGRAPVGPASGDFVDYPLTSTILAAGKITGRLPGRTSLGILTAMTDAESARISDLGAPAIRSVRVAPRTLYGLSKVQREFGSAGSTASVLVGTVHRAFEGGDPLADLLSRNALVYGADAVLRFKRGEYELRSAIVGSYVQGQAAAIERIQRSSAHYMQRPDKGYSRIDPTRTSMSGFSPSLNFDRRSGSHWLFGIQAKLDGPTFEPNDLALLNAADGVETNGNVTYRETRPGRVFRNYSIRLNQSNEWNFGGDRQRGALQPSATVTWANFWNTALSFSRDFRTRNASLTRGGPLIGGPHGWSTTASFSNSSTSRTRWSGGFTASRNEMGGKGRSINGSFSFRPGPRWELSVAPSYVRSTDAQQYVATVSGGRPATFGNRYVFAHIERRTVSAQLRMAFTLRPDLTLDLYAEPFAASGRYDNFGELLEPASRDRLTYGTSGTAISLQADGSRIVTAGTSTFTLTNGDFTVRSFRSNVVLRWEWRPGSTVYVVWQQSRENREAVVTRIDAGDLVASFTEPGTNILLFKASFWIPFR